MTQPEFSKGLEIVPANENHGFYLVDEADLPVCDFYFANPSASTGDSYVHQFHNAKANAHLFAAAPELYEIAEGALRIAQIIEEVSVRCLPNTRDGARKPRLEEITEAEISEIYALAKAARPTLAKARGEQP